MLLQNITLAQSDAAGWGHPHLKTSPEIIHVAVMLYIRFPLSLRNVEDFFHERASKSATRRFDTGGTGSVRCSSLR
jgi:hypothetical protein